jgi:hypothetical protein
VSNDVWAAGVVLFELLFDGAWIVPGVYASPSGVGESVAAAGAGVSGGVSEEDSSALQQLVQLLDSDSGEV